MSDKYIRIIGEELWFDGLKIGTLHPTIPSVDAAVRVYLTKMLAEKSVREWPSS